MPWIEQIRFVWDSDPNPDGQKPTTLWDEVELHVETNDYFQTIPSLRARVAIIRNIKPPIPNKATTDLSSIGFKPPDDDYGPDQDLGYVIKAWIPRPAQQPLL